MSINGKLCAVTGGDGFIGSHLVEALVLRGARVRALAQYNSFDSNGWLDSIAPDIREHVEIQRGDVRDPHFMNRFVDGADVVFHLAALISIPYSYVAPQSYVDVNITGTLNMLEACRTHGVGRIIHTSTSEVYGTALYTPIDEKHPTQGQSPYSASKIGADKIVESYVRSFEMEAVTLRPFNTYGPRQSERAVIPTVIRQFLDPSILELRLGNLTPVRDFNFVKDTADAFIALAEAASPKFGEAYNAGTGRSFTIGDMVKMVAEITGSNKSVVEDRERFRPPASEVFTLIAKSDRFAQASDWGPQYTFEQGLSETVDWWRDRFERGDAPVHNELML
jgi:NAD dependent epimerase/dehydratase